MWIYKKTEKGASLINTDHVTAFIIKDGEVIAVYDSFPDGQQLKTSVAKVGSEQEARDFHAVAGRASRNVPGADDHEPQREGRDDFP